MPLAPNTQLRDGWLVRTALIACAAVSTLCSFTWGWKVTWPATAVLVVGAILDAANPSRATATEWGWSFGALGVGGLIATACAWRLARNRA